MGIFIAVIIIVALIFYALKDLLVDKDFAAWTNIALTSLILFTVILSIFMILHKKPSENVSVTWRHPADTSDTAQPGEPSAQPQAQQPSAPLNLPTQVNTDEEAVLAFAKEYVNIEEEYKKNNPNAKDAAQVASSYMKAKYDFSQQEWQDFLQKAAEINAFAKARAAIKK